MTEFKFLDEDPRCGTRRNNPISYEFADALRANPNRWAEYPFRYSTAASAGATAHRINKGAIKALRSPEFQAVSRGGIVYVRYVKDGAE